MGALLSLIPGKDLVYGALIVALIIFGVYERNHLIAEGAQHELAALKISSDRLQQAAAKQVTQTAADYAASLSTIKENLDEQQRTNSVLASTDAQRLRDFDAYRRSHPALGGAAGGPGPQATGAGSTITVDEVLSGLEQSAQSLAAATRSASAALTACMADRDSLVGK